MSDQIAPEPEKNEEETPTFAVSNAAYNKLRFSTLILLPAIAALYFGIAQIWGLPKAEEVVGTITVIDTFGGLLVRSLRVSYENSDARFDGQITVIPDHDAGTTDGSIRLDPTAVATKDEVLVKVKKIDKS